MIRNTLPLLLFVFMLAACGQASRPVVVHAADQVPERLSDWGVVLADGRYFELNDGVTPYGLNTPLFTDYALKMRTVWIPDGTTIGYAEVAELDFPVGTIISKTFHYEKADGFTTADYRVVRSDRESLLGVDQRLDLGDYVLMETRVLVRYEDGWQAFPYVWNTTQDEAWLEVAGDFRMIELVGRDGSEVAAYIVPDSNQCGGCHVPNHAEKAIRPIGPKAWQLNRDYDYGSQTANQLVHWADKGLLAGLVDSPPAGVRWSDPGDATLEQRAKDYLDINCAHCHSEIGAADTSGLFLNREVAVGRHYGICKSPVAVGRGSGDRPYDIYPGEPGQSILLYRMEHTDPAIAMPELGRSTVHTEGVKLIADWINSMPGIC